jgi:cohesin complex subunit SCC1
MFFSQALLLKSGPLAKIWLSAHLDRKLSKKKVLQSNIADSIAVILTPDQAPLALRLSSQLLLGAVRIYHRKTRYLLDDCDNTWVMMMMVHGNFLPFQNYILRYLGLPTKRRP